MAPPIHHETSDIDIRAVLLFGAGLIVVGIAIHLVVWVLFRSLEGREARRDTVEYPLALSAQDRLPPEPRLQTNPREDLRALHAGEERILTTYDWVDKNAGIVRIPIDQAMKLIVTRGLPARAEAQRAP